MPALGWVNRHYGKGRSWSGGEAEAAHGAECPVRASLRLGGRGRGRHRRGHRLQHPGIWLRGLGGWQCCPQNAPPMGTAGTERCLWGRQPGAGAAPNRVFIGWSPGGPGARTGRHPHAPVVTLLRPPTRLSTPGLSPAQPAGVRPPAAAAPAHPAGQGRPRPSAWALAICPENALCPKQRPDMWGTFCDGISPPRKQRPPHRGLHAELPSSPAPPSHERRV